MLRCPLLALALGVGILPTAVQGVPRDVSGLDVEHEAVACIAAGHFPQLTACFRPSGELARGRVYFQAEGATSGWHYVEMQSASPCWGGTLPKPSKALVGRHILYYLEGTSRSLGSARTAEQRALVVSSPEECRGRLAAMVPSGPSAVLPNLPQGFALAGRSLPLLVGAGAAVVGGTTVLVAGGPSASPNPQPTPTPQPVPTPTPTPTPAPTPTPNPTPTPTPTPTPGPSPSPSPTPTPSPSPQPTPTPTPSPSPTPPAAEMFPLGVSRTGAGRGRVTSQPAGIDCGTSCSASYAAATTVTLQAQAEAGSSFAGWGGACSGTGTCVVVMDAARNVSARFDLRTFTLRVNKTPLLDLGTVRSTPAGIDCAPLCFSASAVFGAGTQVTLRALPLPLVQFKGWGGACSGSGACVVTMDSDQLVTADFALLGLGAAAVPQGTIPPPDGPLLLRVVLDVPDGRAEVLVDGRRVLSLERGEALLVLADAAASPTVEGRLLHASGPGNWRFEVVARDHVAGEGIRPLVGEVLWTTSKGVAYRLRGTTGELLAFRLAASPSEDARPAAHDR